MGSQSWTQLSNFTFTFHFHALEKEMATHSSIFAWRIPGTEEPGRLPSTGSHRVGHDWSDLAAAAAGILRVCVHTHKTPRKNSGSTAWFLLFSLDLCFFEIESGHEILSLLSCRLAHTLKTCFYILFNVFSRVVMGGISLSIGSILYWELNQQLGFYLF